MFRAILVLIFSLSFVNLVSAADARQKQINKIDGHKVMRIAFKDVAARYPSVTFYCPVEHQAFCDNYLKLMTERRIDQSVSSIQQIISEWWVKHNRSF